MTQTKGPWSVVIHSASGHAYAISGTNRGIVNWGGLSKPASKETLANAHLIAAAPDLLEALEKALDSLVFAAVELGAQAHIPHEDSEMITERIGLARKAIAKAKGQSNE